MCHVFLFQSSCLFAWATKDCNQHLQVAFFAFLAGHQRRTCLAIRMVLLGFLVHFFGCLSHRPLRSLLWRSCHWSPMALWQRGPVKKLATQSAGWFSFLESLWDLAKCKWCSWMALSWPCLDDATVSWRRIGVWYVPCVSFFRVLACLHGQLRIATSIYR